LKSGGKRALEPRSSLSDPGRLLGNVRAHNRSLRLSEEALAGDELQKGMLEVGVSEGANVSRF